MTPRSKILWWLFAFLLFGMLAWKSRGQDWQTLNWSGPYTPAEATARGGDLATFDVPHACCGNAYTAFLVTTNTPWLIGNLSNTILMCSMTVEASNTIFMYGGENDWNWCPRPANCRFFISSEVGYSKAQYQANPMDFWFEDLNWVEISTNTGTAVISTGFDLSHWSDAGGSTNIYTQEERTNAFWNVVSNVRQIGLSYGGACFFDCGIAYSTLGGPATFHLNWFEALLPQSVDSKHVDFVY